jgi:hypothetical protein
MNALHGGALVHNHRSCAATTVGDAGVARTAFDNDAYRRRRHRCVMMIEPLLPKPAKLRHSNTSGHDRLFFDDSSCYLRKNRRCLRSNALRPTILNMLGNETRFARATLRAGFVVKHQFF